VRVSEHAEGWWNPSLANDAENGSHALAQSSGNCPLTSGNIGVNIYYSTQCMDA
jgi:hypothetical protein